MSAAGVAVTPDDIAAVDAVGVGRACPRHIEGGVGRAVIKEAVIAAVAVPPDDIDTVDAVGVGIACPRYIEGGVGGAVITETVIAAPAVVVVAFQADCVRAEHLDGTTPIIERDLILKKLRNGDIDVVSNCQVLYEGWDLPALECAIIARPTTSKCLHLQCVGRIMRAVDGKAGAIVLDHAGNHLRHGFVTDRINYSLETSIESYAGAQRGPAEAKVCFECDALVGVASATCSECGYKFPSGVPEEVDGELVIAGGGADFNSHAKVWRDLELQRERCGYRQGWSRHKFNERFSEWPVVVAGELVNTTCANMQIKQAVFQQLETVRISKGFQRGWTAHKYREVFGVWPRGVAV